MIERVLLLGGTSDLASRHLVPGLAELAGGERLPEATRLVGVGRHDLNDDDYRERIAGALRAADADPRFARRFSYVKADASDVAALARALEGARGPVLAYLALPPAIAGSAAKALADAGLPEGSRVAIEKPFGEDLASAERLNALLAERYGAKSVFRVDHFLGLRAVRDLGAWMVSRPLAALLTAQHVSRVAITWDETLALEGRAGYYDPVGALKDMVQNHLLQVLATLASHDGLTKVDVLRRTAVLEPERLGSCVVRAQYDGYRDEDGVDSSRGTETFVRLALGVETPRWRGVPFVLRTGKALARDRHEVVFDFEGGHGRLVVDLDEAKVSLATRVGGDELVLSGKPEERAPSAYACVLDALLRGDERRFVGPREAEEQWRIVEPVVRAFQGGAIALGTYTVGSEGPSFGS